MTKDEFIEAMARAAWIADGGFDGDPVEAERWWSAVGRGIYIKMQEAALPALEAAIPGLADVIAGRAVIVPVEDRDIAVKHLRSQAEKAETSIPKEEELHAAADGLIDTPYRSPERSP